MADTATPLMNKFFFFFSFSFELLATNQVAAPHRVAQWVCTGLNILDVVGPLKHLLPALYYISVLLAPGRLDPSASAGRRNEQHQPPQGKEEEKKNVTPTTPRME
jgi:hypothetical protein